jgi:hypothetical protein
MPTPPPGALVLKRAETMERRARRSLNFAVWTDGRRDRRCGSRGVHALAHVHPGRRVRVGRGRFRAGRRRHAYSLRRRLTRAPSATRPDKHGGQIVVEFFQRVEAD